MTIIDGTSCASLAKLHNVHRATATRWLQKARDELARLTKLELSQRLQIQESDVDSIVRLVRSRIDVSVRRLLVDGEEGKV
jgi:RNA polymerase sigma-70 factor (ECF subfamily)